MVGAATAVAVLSLSTPAAAQRLPLAVERATAIEGGLAGAALVLLLVAAWLYGRWRVAEAASTASAQERLRLDQMLAVAPDGFFRWDLADDGTVSDGLCSRRLAVLLGLAGGTASKWLEVRGCFGEAEAAILEVAVDALHRNGVGFEMELSMRDSIRRLMVVGTRAADDAGRPLADQVWMRDVTAATAALDQLSVETSSLEDERDRLRGLLDALPMPAWLRDADLAIVICNAAYARAVDARGPGDAVARGIELVPGPQGREARALAARARAAGEPRSDRLHLVIGGARRLTEITETPFTTPRGTLLTVGLAVDRTDEEELHDQLDSHISAHGTVLEALGSAIAIFSADGKLAFFNSAFTRLWRLDPEWLASDPGHAGLLDRLRELRRLPEVADFRAYKEEELRLYTQLVEPREDLLHLPDERTLRRFVVPHPFGGLLFVFEDVTDRLALERSLTTSLAVHRATLENLHEGVAVFSSDGRLRLSNPAYGRVWNLSANDLAGEPHFAELVGRHRGFFDDGEHWQEQRTLLLSLLGERQARGGRLARADGSILDYASVPLPDGALLTTWLDVSDRVRAEGALRERNEAMAAADRLKAEFIANINAELRAPLATILEAVEAFSAGTGEAGSDRIVALSAAARQLQQGIADFLDLAAIESGELGLAVEQVEVGALAESALSLARERPSDRAVTLDYQPTPGGGRVAGDARRLRQALYSLLANAMRAAPDGGRVSLRVGREPGFVLFTVAVAGEGMEAATREQLFGRAGAGLGPSLVRRFVALHGGTVLGDAEAGSITLRLPAGEG